MELKKQKKEYKINKAPRKYIGINIEKEIGPKIGMVFKRDKNIPMIKSKVIRINMVKGDKIIDFQFWSENLIPLIIGEALFPRNWFNVILDNVVDQKR